MRDSRVDLSRSLSSGQSGAAALEVLLLIPFILLIFALLFNMGYNAERHRQTQAALRLGGFEYVSGMATMNKTQAEDAAEALVNSTLFPGESNQADLYFSNSNQKPPEFQDDENLLSNASSRITVGVNVKRSAPYPSLVNNSDMTAQYVVSSNTWTYCEMKDEDFASTQADIMNATAIVGDYLLWLFGGCGGDVFEGCKDECP